MSAKPKIRLTYEGRAVKADGLNLQTMKLVTSWRGELVRSDGVVVARRGPYADAGTAKRQASRLVKSYQRYFDHYGYCFYDEQQDKKARDKKVKDAARAKVTAAQKAGPDMLLALEHIRDVLASRHVEVTSAGGPNITDGLRSVVALAIAKAQPAETTTKGR